MLDCTFTLQDDLYRKILYLEILAKHFDMDPNFVGHVCHVLDDLFELLPPNRSRIVMVHEEVGEK